MTEVVVLIIVTAIITMLVTRPLVAAQIRRMTALLSSAIRALLGTA